MTRAARIPYGAWPRGLAGEELAAFYVGETPTAFREGIKNGIWPQSRKSRGRNIWDRELLDQAMDRQNGLDAEPGEKAALEAVHEHRKAALR
jgi:hypothetical protein